MSERRDRVADLAAKMTDGWLGQARDEVAEAVLLNLLFLIFDMHGKCCCQDEAGVQRFVARAIHEHYDRARGADKKSREGGRTH